MSYQRTPTEVLALQTPVSTSGATALWRKWPNARNSLRIGDGGLKGRLQAGLPATRNAALVGFGVELESVGVGPHYQTPGSQGFAIGREEDCAIDGIPHCQFGLHQSERAGDQRRGHFVAG